MLLYTSRNIGGWRSSNAVKKRTCGQVQKVTHLLDSDHPTIKNLSIIEFDNKILMGINGRTVRSLHLLLGINSDRFLYFRHNFSLSNLWTSVRKLITSFHCKIDDGYQNYLLIIEDVSCFASKITKSTRLALRERWSAKLKNLSVQGRVARAFSLDVRSNDIPYLISQRT